MIKLTRKLVLLAILTMTLGFFAMTDLGTTPSGAAPCCTLCDEIYLGCQDLPPGTERNRCLTRASNCFRWCSRSC